MWTYTPTRWMDSPHTPSVGVVLQSRSIEPSRTHIQWNSVLWASSWIQQNKVRKGLPQNLGIRRSTRRISDLSQSCHRNESDPHKNWPQHGSSSIRPKVLLVMSRHLWQGMYVWRGWMWKWVDVGRGWQLKQNWWHDMASGQNEENASHGSWTNLATENLHQRLVEQGRWLTAPTPTIAWQVTSMIYQRMQVIIGATGSLRNSSLDISTLYILQN